MAHADPSSELATKPLGRLLLRFAIPSIFAQIVNLLYNIVDRIFVGRIPEIGPLALAGLGVAFPIILIISSFSFLAGMGGAPLASTLLRTAAGRCAGHAAFMGGSRVILRHAVGVFFKSFVQNRWDAPPSVRSALHSCSAAACRAARSASLCRT